MNPDPIQINIWPRIVYGGVVLSAAHVRELKRSLRDAFRLKHAGILTKWRPKLELAYQGIHLEIGHHGNGVGLRLSNLPYRGWGSEKELETLVIQSVEHAITRHLDFWELSGIFG